MGAVSKITLCILVLIIIPSTTFAEQFYKDGYSIKMHHVLTPFGQLQFDGMISEGKPCKKLTVALFWDNSWDRDMIPVIIEILNYTPSTKRGLRGNARASVDSDFYEDYYLRAIHLNCEN